MGRKMKKHEPLIYVDVKVIMTDPEYQLFKQWLYEHKDEIHISLFDVTVMDWFANLGASK